MRIWLDRVPQNQKRDDMETRNLHDREQSLGDVVAVMLTRVIRHVQPSFRTLCDQLYEFNQAFL